MGITASDVITLAQNTKALTKEQLARILEVAPDMSADDLENLRKMVLAAQESEVAEMKHELDLRQQVGAVRQEWEADKSRAQLQSQEGTAIQHDSAQAESLIQTI